MTFHMGHHDNAGAEEAYSDDDNHHSHNAAKPSPNALLDSIFKKKLSQDILLDTNFKDDNLDDVPGIEAVATHSFSPTSESSVCSSSILEKGGEEGKNLKKFSLPPLLVASSTPKSQESDYISKEALEVLLTPRCFEDYQDLVARSSAYNPEDGWWGTDSTTSSPTAASDAPALPTMAEREERRELIQTELDQLVQNAEEFQELEEVEPEAVEALGIAANRLAYRQRYYNVATSRYIYFPSAAYCLLEGCLLEEATKHYFGRSDEFLVKYAGGLGSTILNQQRQQDLLEEDNHSQVEAVDWGDENENENENMNGIDQFPSPNNSNVANRVWGWSPRSRESNYNFDFEDISTKKNTTVELADKTQTSERHRIGTLKIVAVFCIVLILAILAHSCLWPMQRRYFEQNNRHLLTASPMRRSAIRQMKQKLTTTIKESKSRPEPRLKTFPTMDRLSSTAMEDEDKMSSQVEAIVEGVKQMETVYAEKLESIAEEAKAEQSNMAASGPSTKKKRSTGDEPGASPIVPNLLYRHNSQ